MTGMGKGKLLGLSWENVDLEYSVIYVLKSPSGKASPTSAVTGPFRRF